MNRQEELDQAIERVILSQSRRKLVVAGPGAGKTYLFRRLLESSVGSKKTRIVVTFLSKLVQDIASGLSEMARVCTLHALAQRMLRRSDRLRGGLTAQFVCQPRLASLIKDDFQIITGSDCPKVVDQMRRLERGATVDFYMRRGEYYDAVDFDDSVLRVVIGMTDDPRLRPTFDLVLVDEYQDFNLLEASVIGLLASTSPIVVAGDDDQALYGKLRGATTTFIRELYIGGQFDRFELPFCLRCPEAVIHAVGDVISNARQRDRLKDRIEKQFRFFPPIKSTDSAKYPKLRVVSASIQSTRANQMGKYVFEALRNIPQTEVDESREKAFPAALIIGSRPYLPQVCEFLRANNVVVNHRTTQSELISRLDGLNHIKKNEKSNLGWRIMIEAERLQNWKGIVEASAVNKRPIADYLDQEFLERVLAEVRALERLPDDASVAESSKPTPLNLATSYEGSKGLSAQHVFVVGLQDGDIPRKPSDVQDIEICKFIVALTRTRKQCHLIFASRFGRDPKRRSTFIDWIDPMWVELVRVDKNWTWARTA